jgi:protein ImuB
MAASECEVLVDIAGLGRLIGPPDEIARQLAHALFDARLSASVAIGATQTIARVLAHGVEAGHDLALQGPWLHLPVEFLRELEVLPPGLNPRDRLRPYETRDAQRLYDTLARWGIETLGELAALPAADLASRLGRRGAALQQLARGVDPRPFVPDPETRRFIERLELEWPIDALEPLSFVLARLLDPLSEALERADRGAVAIRLELRLTDRSTCTRVLPLPVPMRDARVLRTLLLLALEANPPLGDGSGGPSELMIDIVSIELDPAPARIVRFSLLDRALPSPETLATLTARLSALVGESRVGAAVLLDSHAPDAFEMARFQPDATAQPKVGPAETSLRDGGSVLRRQRVPPAVRVALERGRPVHLASSRRGIPYGAIVDAAGPWRTSGGWWLDPGGWNRNEWDVALKSGAVCRIYQDRTTERWFLEGVYD